MGNKRTATKAKEPPVIEGLDNAEALRQLEAAAAHLGLQVRYEKGDFRSAGCRVQEQRLVILQKNDSDAVKIQTLLQELSRFDCSSFDIHPAIIRTLVHLKPAEQEVLTPKVEEM